MPASFRPLVVVEKDQRLFGKIVRADERHVIVEFFHGVGTRERLQLPRASCAHAFLQKQTRIFYNPNGNLWRVGRVIDAYRQPNGLFEYEVRFPNRTDAVVGESEIFVRAVSEFGDPAANLAAGCAETQFFADRRRRALGRLLQMRAAAEGLTGLVSAAVDLVPHQLAVIRRILQDPIQRYVLADEVGLGKTIEAGVIIRQTLIDDPNRTILVLAPQSMIEQWRGELVDKIHIDDFMSSGIEIAAYSHALKVRRAPDLLVVDEAHQVVALSGDDELTPEKTAIAHLVASAPRVLLLSATPPVGEEDRLFGLVHLLDPVLYPDSKRTAFKEKLADRGRIGRLLLALQPGGQALPLRHAANQAKKLFAADQNAVEAADAVIAAGNDKVALDHAATLLRDHIVETYRIHRRLLRSRRVDAERVSMRRRGLAVVADQDPDLSHVRLDWPDDVISREICQALESWHAAAQAHAKVRPDLRDPLAMRCLELHEALACGPATLSALARSLKPLFAQEGDHFSAMAREITEADSADRYGTLLRMLREWRRALPPPNGGVPAKIVCFASDPSDADILTQRLRQVLGPGALRRLPADERAPAVIDDFAAHKEEWVLVCDRSGEEGLNLQFAHGVLHADLPFDPSRLEQRIGRLDRYGRRLKMVAHRVFLPDEGEETVWRSWFDLLANGFLIFNQSVSDVQFCLEELQNRTRYALFDNGGVGLSNLVGEIRTTLTEERQRLDEQYVFEAAIAGDEAAEQIVMRMEDEEADEGTLAADLHPWMTKVIGLEPFPAILRKGAAVKWARSKETLVPKFPWLERFAPGLDKPTTWWRQEALRNPDQNLLRPGAVLIDRLEDFARWDDRGTAFATWRIGTDFREPWCGFQLTWVIEPGAATARDILKDSDEGGLARRAMALLPPWMVTHYLDEDLRLVEDATLLEILQRPYGNSDVNLGNQPNALASVIDPVRFAELCEAARGTGRHIVQDSVEYKQRLDKARSAVERELGSQRRGLQRRLTLACPGDGDADVLAAELVMLDRIGHAAQEPAVRLDAIGFFVITAGPLAVTAK